ncbi:MAG: hypothetical protein LBQ48_04775 [Oscillospiraceae bacterium]|jgi:hypothetical protein|nr:hypothetical protein [Oscillospiraceae bacterium]
MKKVLALLLAACLFVSLAACHKKGEIALTVDGYEIPAALYLYFLVTAEYSARNTLAAPDENGTATVSVPSDTNELAKQVINGQTFYFYVKEQALAAAKNHVAFIREFEKHEVMTDEKKKECDSYAEAYWNYYGYKDLFVPNGVSLATYKQAFLVDYFSGALYEKLFDKDGVLAASEEEAKTYLQANYALANTLTMDLTSTETDEDGNIIELTDEQKAAKKAALEKYMTRLNNGEAFDKVKADYDIEFPAPTADEDAASEEEPAASEAASEETASSESTSSADTASEDETPAAQDPDAVVFKSAEVVQYESTASGSSDGTETEGYTKLLEVEVGKAAILELSNSFMLVLRKDIMADPFYYDTNYFTVSKLLKASGYEGDLSAETEQLSIIENSYVIGYLSAKKIKYPAGA